MRRRMLLSWLSPAATSVICLERVRSLIFARAGLVSPIRQALVSSLLARHGGPETVCGLTSRRRRTGLFAELPAGHQEAVLVLAHPIAADEEFGTDRVGQSSDLAPHPPEPASQARHVATGLGVHPMHVVFDLRRVRVGGDD